MKNTFREKINKDAIYRMVSIAFTISYFLAQGPMFILSLVSEDGMPIVTRYCLDHSYQRPEQGDIVASVTLIVQLMTFTILALIFDFK